MPSLFGAISGAELTSSHPSAPAVLIHDSSPLTIPSSVSLKTTIRSKYSHCIDPPSNSSARTARLNRLSDRLLLCHPARSNLDHLAVQLEFSMVEPARQVTDQAILMLHVRPQVRRDVTELCARQHRLQTSSAVEHRRNVAFSVQQQARAFVTRDRDQEIEQLNRVAGVRLTHRGAREVLEHPFPLGRNLGNDCRRDRDHVVRGTHQSQPPPQADTDCGSATETPDVSHTRFDLSAH